MTPEKFNQIFAVQFEMCESILNRKASEYSDGKDRLHNFKVAAALQDVPLREALAGMMAKHTVSIYDMCYDKHYYPQEVWQEKITDHMNYLFLLAAVVVEEFENA